MLVAAGTVTNAELLDKATVARADFCVDSGLTPALMRFHENSICLPGVATAPEVMLGLEHGLTLFKLFRPWAGVNGFCSGHWPGPFPDVRFCPTGDSTLPISTSLALSPNRHLLRRIMDGDYRTGGQRNRGTL